LHITVTRYIGYDIQHSQEIAANLQH